MTKDKKNMCMRLKLSKLISFSATAFFVCTYIPIFCSGILILIPLRFLKLFSKDLFKRTTQIIGGFVARSCLWTAFSSAIIYGKENIPVNRGNVVYICSHQSFFDIPAFLGWVDNRARFVARENLYRIPFLRGWLKALRCFPVGRRATREEIKRFDLLTDALRENDVIVIFPEGTRSRTAELGEFKTSAFRPARKSQSTIVPVLIQGSRNILPRGKKTIRPSRVSITIGEPVEYNDYCDIIPAGLADMFQKKIASLNRVSD